MSRYFVTGIGTGVGKTLISAIITESLKADYWKPIQTGKADSDSRRIRSLIANSSSKIHQEAFGFDEPQSPHIAAKADGVSIQLESIKLPTFTNQNLVIEGAGGVLVPLNEGNFMIELANKFNAEVVLVISSYLGCINHSLLSLNYLFFNRYKIKGLVFNGDFEDGVKSIIETHFKVPILLECPQLKNVDHQSIVGLASKLKW